MAKPQQKQAQSKTLIVTISGSYRAPNKGIESFEDVTGVMPRMDDDKVNQMAIKRYAPIWVQKAKKTENGNQVARYSGFQRIRQVFVDSISDNEEQPDAELSYVGKSIMDMNMEELQDLAAANDLAAVPLYKSGSLTSMRRVAFSEYAIKILDLFEEGTTRVAMKAGAKSTNKYDWRVPGFNPNKFEPIFADGEVRRQRASIDMEEAIEEGLTSVNESMARAPAFNDNGQKQELSRLTMRNLMDIADSKNISYNKNISYGDLHKKLYGTQAA